jgi:CubicO group peptidase (beta-lactamase class C family)
MKKLMKFLGITLLSILALVFIILAGLSIKYSPRYIYRLARYNVADVYDYKFFPNRTIEGTHTAVSFPVSINEDYFESLFKDRVLASGFNSFNEWAEKSRTTALIMIRRDTILYEKYFNGFSRDSYFHSQSVAKSFISLLIGFAIEDGYIQSVDDPMTDYLPELLNRESRFGKITIKNLLMMQSGLKYNEAYLPGVGIHAPWHDEAVGYYHGNVRKLLLKKVEVGGEPGKDFQYCNYNTSYLGLIIERATGKSVSEYLEEKLWSRVMEYDALFSTDSKKSGFEYVPSRLIARAVDYARFGQLFLHEGNWHGTQIIPEEWIRESTLEDTTVSREFYPDWMGEGCQRTYYKYQWWGHTNCDSTYQFFASGNLGQEIYILPDKDIVIVHCGNSLNHYNADFLRDASDQIRSYRAIP